MINVPANFHTKIVDGVTEQNFVLLFYDGYFSAMDGDFLDSKVTIEEYMFTGEQIEFGEVPSNHISFELMNPNNCLQGFPWGEARAYIFVKTASASMTKEGNCKLVVDTRTYVGDNSGLLLNGERIYSGRAIIGMTYFDGFVYAYGDGVCLKVSNHTVFQERFNDFMIDKLSHTGGISTVFNDSGNIPYMRVCDNVNGRNETYTGVPMGIFNIKKPLQTQTRVVTIAEAHDRMELFDADCSQFLSELEFPLTEGELFLKVCDAVGVEVQNRSSLTPHINGFDFTYRINETTFNSTNSQSYRNILSIILEACATCCRINRYGKLEVRFFSSSETTIPPERVELDNYSFGEYTVGVPQKETVYNSLGRVVTLPILEEQNAYYMVGNPLVTLPIHVQEIKSTFPEYIPANISVLEDDPSYECGDFVNVEVEQKVNAMLLESSKVVADGLRRAIVGDVNKKARIPIMSQTITWCNKTSGIIQAFGYEIRPCPDEVSKYSATVAQEKLINIEKNGLNCTNNTTGSATVNIVDHDWQQGGSLTVPKNGYYLVKATFSQGGSVGLKVHEGTVKKNGTRICTCGVSSSDSISWYIGSNDETVWFGQLNEGDVLSTEAYGIYQASTTSGAITYTKIEILRIG